MRKKLLVFLGAAATVASPLGALISCSTSDSSVGDGNVVTPPVTTPAKKIIINDAKVTKALEALEYAILKDGDGHSLHDFSKLEVGELANVYLAGTLTGTDITIVATPKEGYELESKKASLSITVPEPDIALDPGIVEQAIAEIGWAGLTDGSGALISNLDSLETGELANVDLTGSLTTTVPVHARIVAIPKDGYTFGIGVTNIIVEVEEVIIPNPDIISGAVTKAIRDLGFDVFTDDENNVLDQAAIDILETGILENVEITITQAQPGGSIVIAAIPKTGHNFDQGTISVGLTLTVPWITLDTQPIIDALAALDYISLIVNEQPVANLDSLEIGLLEHMDLVVALSPDGLKHADITATPKEGYWLSSHDNNLSARIEKPETDWDAINAAYNLKTKVVALNDNFTGFLIQNSEANNSVYTFINPRYTFLGHGGVSSVQLDIGHDLLQGLEKNADGSTKFIDINYQFVSQNFAITSVAYTEGSIDTLLSDQSNFDTSQDGTIRAALRSNSYNWDTIGTITFRYKNLVDPNDNTYSEFGIKFHWKIVRDKWNIQMRYSQYNAYEDIFNTGDAIVKLSASNYE